MTTVEKSDAASNLERPLTDVVSSALGGVAVEVRGIRRLSGGASRETWSFDAMTTDQLRPLILCRDDPSREPHPGFAHEAVAIGAPAARGAAFELLLARMDSAAPRHRGVTRFFVDMRSPGLILRPQRQTSGEADFSKSFLDDVRIPGGQVLATSTAGGRPPG